MVRLHRREMGNSKFTDRLNDSLGLLEASLARKVRVPNSRSLFSPIYRGGKYTWVKIMDSDGVLLSQRTVHDGEGAKVPRPARLLMGVIIQSEDSTSQTKPNPMGKASLSHISNGVWVSLKDKRVRLDRLLVIFVLPKGATPQDSAKFETAKRNVLNAAEMMPDSIAIEVPRGASASDIADALRGKINPFLIGAGRPVG